MPGQAWKYSHQLDERDLAFLQHEFITVPMGIEYYGFSERPLIRMASLYFPPVPANSSVKYSKP